MDYLADSAGTDLVRFIPYCLLALCAYMLWMRLLSVPKKQLKDMSQQIKQLRKAIDDHKRGNRDG